MPGKGKKVFASNKQRRYMFKRHPIIARRWVREEKRRRKK